MVKRQFTNQAGDDYENTFHNVILTQQDKQSTEAKLKKSKKSSTHADDKSSITSKKHELQNNSSNIATKPSKNKKIKNLSSKEVIITTHDSLNPVSSQNRNFISDTLSIESHNADENEEKIQKQNLTDSLIAEILFQSSDFLTELATYVADKINHPWKPKILRIEKQKKLKPKDPNFPRKPMSAYNIWCQHMRDQCKQENTSKLWKLTELAETWRTVQDKSLWEEAANKEKEKYKLEVEAYLKKKSS